MEPSKKQVLFAQSLGIDIPQGADRAKVTKLLDWEIVRRYQEQHGLEHLSIDEAAEVLRQARRRHSAKSLPNPTRYQRCLQIIKDAGIKIGSLVRWTGDEVWVITDISARTIKLRSTTRVMWANLDLARKSMGTTLNLTLVCTPDKGYAHPAHIIAKRAGFNFQGLARWRNDVRARLQPEDIRTHEGHEFWREEAVAQACTDMVSEKEASRKTRREPARFPYCVVCGKGGCAFKPLGARKHRCNGCMNTKLRQERHCVRCSKAFTAENPSSCVCSGCVIRPRNKPSSSTV